MSMQVESIRAFVPSKNYEESQSFYQAMGFKMGKASEDLSIFESGNCTFFIQRFYNEEFANNLMLQLAVKNIQEAFELISSIKGYNIKFEPIKNEPWGKVVYLWGPSGELWHITEFNS
jgi:predicted lactoylglutathione lyase